MNWLIQFFEYPAENLLIYGHFEPWLVTLSVVIAIFTSSMALHLATQAQQAREAGRRLPILLAGSITLGVGVWSMHFIGMLAFDLCTRVTYEPGITLLSMVPSIAASWVALSLNSQRNINRRDLVVGGVLMGAGIGAMHYAGMAAMIMSPLLRYDFAFFLLSIVVAVVLAMLALWIRFGLRQLGFRKMSPLQLNIVSGTVMGLAIAGMHYTGMMAARFVPPQGLELIDNISQPLILAIGVAVATVSITSLVVAVELVLKYRELSVTSRANETRLRAILETAVDGVVIVDMHRRIVAANAAIERIFGWRVSELIGCDANMLMPESLRGQQRGPSDTAGVAREVDVLHKDGHVFPARIARGQVRLPQQEDLFVSFVTDISERVAMERALMLAKEKAEQAAAARTTFLANMSHEIRTPMNAIIGFSDVLMATALTPEQHRHLAVISGSARSLLHLLNDILDSAKLDKGKLALEKLDFSLPDLLDAVLSTLGMQARKKGLELNLDIAANVSNYYLGAPERIRQVLTNIVGNAIKFTEQGRVDISVRLDEAGQVLFAVSDTGIGIAPDRIAAIFEPFTQADATMTRRFGGTGLGTTISKQLVELMGGWIRVRSDVGKGSCFEFSLPLEAGAKPAASIIDAPLELPPLRILAVDDIAQNLDLVKLLLERRGHEVACAGDGLQALELVQKGDFDLILMDMQMPTLDGPDATRRIRAWCIQQGLAPVPIIALTAGVLQEDRLAAREAGMDGFCSKPVDLGALTREIARVLGIEARSQIESVMPARSSPASRGGVLDWEAGLARWGDAAVYNNELTTFAMRYGLLALELDALLAQQDFTALARRAHGARGVAANLAIIGLVAPLSQLEEAAQRCDKGACVDALEKLARALPLFGAELARHLQRVPVVEHDKAEVRKPEDFERTLQALRAAASANECDDAALDLLLQACAPAQAQWAQNIVDAFNNFDFARALGLLDERVPDAGKR
jgi:PAS domain S-box-containing protein